MYTPSRYFADFNIAGFTYGEGLAVFEDLKVGTVLTLEGEPDNPYDPEAVALFLNGSKIGYVPRGKNSELSQFLYFGYGKFFEAQISAVNLLVHPQEQYHVVVRIADIRDSGEVENQSLK
jgi:hypothetical protein